MLFRSGKIIVIAACNEGKKNIYLNIPFEKNSIDEIQAQTVIVFRTINDYVTIWSKNEDRFGIQFAVLNTKNEEVVASEILYPEDDEDGIHIFSDAIGEYFKGEIGAFYGIEGNGKYNMMLKLEGGLISFVDYRLAIRFFGENGTEIDMWSCNNQVEFGNWGSPNMLNGN